MKREDYKTREERFEEYKNWCLKEIRTPLQKSKDPIESFLGQWGNRNRDWEPLIEFDSRFGKKIRKTPEERFEEYKSWCIGHNDTPNSNSNDPIEKSLGHWRTKNRNWEPLIEFNSQFEKKLKSKEERFEEYKNWCLNIGHKQPVMTSKDPIESFLGRWKNINRNWEPLKKFNSQYSVRKTHETSEERFEEYKSWCLEYEKTPSAASKNHIEKSLGYWRSKNKDWDKLKRFDSIIERYMKGDENAIFILNTIKTLEA